MTLVQGLVALGVLFGLGFMIYAKYAKDNPAGLERIKKALPMRISEKLPENSIGEKLEQVYDQRMM